MEWCVVCRVSTYHKGNRLKTALDDFVKRASNPRGRYRVEDRRDLTACADHKVELAASLLRMESNG